MKEFIKELVEFSNYLHVKLDKIREGLREEQGGFDPSKVFNEISGKIKLTEKERYNKCLSRELHKNWKDRQHDLEDFDMILIDFIEKNSSLLDDAVDS